MNASTAGVTYVAGATTWAYAGTLLEGAKSLVEVPAGITRGAKDYAFDARPIHERRRKVAETIERLALP